MTFIDPTDIHGDLDRKAADGQMSHEDAQAIRHFADFLTDPTSRCPICLADDHTTPSTCLTDDEKRSTLPGVYEPERSRLIDAAYARHVTTLTKNRDLTPQDAPVPQLPNDWEDTGLWLRRKTGPFRATFISPKTLRSLLDHAYAHPATGQPQLAQRVAEALVVSGWATETNGGYEPTDALIKMIEDQP